jgi:hypothetical protein
MKPSKHVGQKQNFLFPCLYLRQNYNIARMPLPIFIKLGKHITPPEPISTVHLNKSLPSVIPSLQPSKLLRQDYNIA